MLWLKIALGKGLPAAGAIFFSLYVTRNLTTADADTFFIWFTTLYILSFFGKLGFDTYVLKELSANPLSSAATPKRLALVTSSALATGALLFAPTPIWWLLLSLPTFSLVGINSSIFRAEGRHFLAGFLEISQLSSLALAILVTHSFFKFSATLETVSQCFAAASLAIFIIGETLTQKKDTILCKGATSSLSSPNSLRFIASPLIIYLTQWISIFFLASIDEGGASIYSVAIRLASAFAFIAITIDSFVAPRFAKYYREGKKKDIIALIASVRKKTIPALFIAFLTYSVAGYFLGPQVLGPSYQESFNTSLIIASSYCIFLIVGPYQYFLLMSDEEKKVNLCNFISFVFVTLSTLMLWRLEISSTLPYAIAVATARLVGILLMRHFSLQKLAQ